MRDDGLDRAIDAAGGIAQLARKRGISQPSVSNWTRVPAQRVVAVEAVTGVPRNDLRPDLYGEQAVLAETDAVDAARAQEYALLAMLLSAPPSKRLLDQLARLTGDATPLGRAQQARFRRSWSANISISSWGSAAARCCLTPPTI